MITSVCMYGKSKLYSSGDPYIGIPIYTCDISKEEEDS